METVEYTIPNWRAYYKFKGDEKEDGKNKKKVPVRSIELPVEVRNNGLTQKEIDAATEKEGKMVADDKQEKERIDARNALEEYVYDLRSKLLDEDQLSTFIVESDREELCRLLDETENWLYEEGEDCQRQVYSDRLSMLKCRGEPIKERKMEFEGRTQALEELGGGLQLAKKGIDQIKLSVGKDDKYSHITDEEIQKLEKAVHEKWSWLEEKRATLSNTPRTQQPPILVAQIRSEKQSLDNTVFSILNKPKPKVEHPKEEKSKEKSTDEHKNSQNNQGGNETQNNQRQADEENMDVE